MHFGKSFIVLVAGSLVAMSPISGSASTVPLSTYYPNALALPGALLPRGCQRRESSGAESVGALVPNAARRFVRAVQLGSVRHLSLGSVELEDGHAHLQQDARPMRHEQQRDLLLARRQVHAEHAQRKVVVREWIVGGRVLRPRQARLQRHRHVELAVDGPRSRSPRPRRRSGYRTTSRRCGGPARHRRVAPRGIAPSGRRTSTSSPTCRCRDRRPATTRWLAKSAAMSPRSPPLVTGTTTCGTGAGIEARSQVVGRGIRGMRGVRRAAIPK